VRPFAARVGIKAGEGTLALAKGRPEEMFGAASSRLTIPAELEVVGGWLVWLVHFAEYWLNAERFSLCRRLD
jgi:hypothetical protein